MRQTFIAAILMLLAGGAINAFWCVWLMKAFLRDIPAIDSHGNLVRLKRLVGFQMYGALLQTFLLVVPFGLFFLGVYLNALSTSDVRYAIVASAVSLLAGLYVKSVEAEVKGMSVAEEFRHEYAEIIDVWMNKVFPTW